MTPPPEPKRRWVQFHFSTAIVMMLVSATLLLLNFNARRMHGHNFEGSVPDRESELALTQEHTPFPYYQQRMCYGWPQDVLVYIRQVDGVKTRVEWNDENESKLYPQRRTGVLVPVRPLNDNEFSIFHSWFSVSGFTINLLLNLLIVVLVGYVLELRFRNRQD